MKNILGYILVFILLVTPLYPALLTKDLRIVIPTSDPVLQERCETPYQNCQAAPGITLRVIKNGQGISLVREQTKSWITISTLPGNARDMNAERHVHKLLQKHNMKAENDNINVILE